MNYVEATVVASNYLDDNHIVVTNQQFGRFVDSIVANSNVPIDVIASSVGIGSNPIPQPVAVDRPTRVTSSIGGNLRATIDDFIDTYMLSEDTNVRANTAEGEPMSLSEEDYRDFEDEFFNPQEDVYSTLYNTVFSARPNRRSEREMMMDIVRQDDFPKPNFKDWVSNKELHDIIDNWYRNVDYREQWIFARREREGFNRRNIRPFSLDDIMARMTKRKNSHHLNTDKSKFYDWKLGGTEWLLRLELFQEKDNYFLISHYIHKPSNVEIKYDVRYWNGDRFKHLFTLFSEHKENVALFERTVARFNDDEYFNDNEECCEDDC